MNPRIVIDGNAFYEIDEDCVQRRKEQQRKEGKEWTRGAQAGQAWNRERKPEER